MRSEKEMLDLIINTANEDPRIRAAYLEGSRVNPTVQADIFQAVSYTHLWEYGTGYSHRFNRFKGSGGEPDVCLRRKF